MTQTQADLHPYYQFSRPEVRHLVPQTARRVLDVGCAAGAMGAALKAERPGAIVEGVEVVGAAAAVARGRLDRVYEGAIEAIAPTLPRGAYDAIVLADVLEHTVEPGQVLRLLRPLLHTDGQDGQDRQDRQDRSNGALVLSVPNVRHWSVLRPLLEGRFDYADLGILDRTHLRFFTRTTLLQLLAHEGLTLRRLAPSRSGAPAPAPVIQALAHAGLVVDTLADESGVYQYMLVCQPGPSWPRVNDEVGLRALLGDAAAAGAAAAARAVAEEGQEDGAAFLAAYQVAQQVALLSEATGPDRVANGLYESVARVLCFALDRFCQGAMQRRAAPLREGAEALVSLASALGM